MDFCENPEFTSGYRFKWGSLQRVKFLTTIPTTYTPNIAFAILASPPSSSSSSSSILLLSKPSEFVMTSAHQRRWWWVFQSRNTSEVSRDSKKYPARGGGGGSDEGLKRTFSFDHESVKTKKMEKHCFRPCISRSLLTESLERTSSKKLKPGIKVSFNALKQILQGPSRTQLTNFEENQGFTEAFFRLAWMNWNLECSGKSTMREEDGFDGINCWLQQKEHEEDFPFPDDECGETMARRLWTFETSRRSWSEPRVFWISFTSISSLHFFWINKSITDWFVIIFQDLWLKVI